MKKSAKTDGFKKVADRSRFGSNIKSLLYCIRLKEFPRAKPEGTPEGGGVYLTIYPESSPDTDIISF